MDTGNRITRESIGTSVRFNVPGIGVLEIDAKALAPALQERAMMHGLIQTIGDAAALSYTQPDGSVKRPSMQEKYDEMKKRVDTLTSGAWSATPARGPRDSYTSIVLAAVARVSGKPEEECATWLESLSKDDARAVRASAPVQKAMFDIKCERAAGATVPETSILATFMAGNTPKTDVAPHNDAPKPGKKSGKKAK